MTTFFCLCRCHNGSECGECGECDECGECAEDCNDAGGERDGDRMESYAELEWKEVVRNEICLKSFVSRRQTKSGVVMLNKRTVLWDQC